MPHYIRHPHTSGGCFISEVLRYALLVTNSFLFFSVRLSYWFYHRDRYILVVKFYGSDLVHCYYTHHHVLPVCNNAFAITLYIQQLVRVSLAENIATIAETAVRFLELSQVAASADVQVCLHFIDIH